MKEITAEEMRKINGGLVILSKQTIQRLIQKNRN